MVFCLLDFLLLLLHFSLVLQQAFANSTFFLCFLFHLCWLSLGWGITNKFFFFWWRWLYVDNKLCCSCRLSWQLFSWILLASSMGRLFLPISILDTDSCRPVSSDLFIEDLLKKEWWLVDWSLSPWVIKMAMGNAHYWWPVFPPWARSLCLAMVDH